ncbi:ABC transporter ATP-binding protein [Tannockella kyphosi]|uniref:ABC transporter ATP-binding protein n=1 Tax=Tannockella kyphosi TaxID=2899121 RepID=UPI002010D79E|nr:ABC transporter ATP-binding protein [Tannockella kyphosi]
MNIITMNEVKVGYEKNIIIDDLSLSIKKGQITTIIGENGCGKSTLLKTIGRILRPKHGEVFVEDLNIHKTNTKQIAKIIGMLPQSPKAPSGLSVGEIVEYGRFPHKKKRERFNQEDHDIINWALEQTDLLEFKDRNINALSGGQRQRVWVAMVLAQQTDVILLDEPTTYLDMAYQLEVLQLVQSLNKDKGITVIMVLHDINQASRFSDELIMLKKGEVIRQGSPKEIMNKENLREVFKIEANIINLPDSEIPVCISYELMDREVHGGSK